MNSTEIALHYHKLRFSHIVAYCGDLLEFSVMVANSSDCLIDLKKKI